MNQFRDHLKYYGVTETNVVMNQFRDHLKYYGVTETNVELMLLNLPQERLHYCNPTCVTRTVTFAAV